MKIYCAGEHKTLDFAAEELKKYLNMMSNQKIVVETRDNYQPEQDCIWLGLTTDMPLPYQSMMPSVNDCDLDDFILINTEDGDNIISGGNPRSVLLAVYRYLTELGCRWLRPGTEGELIPENNQFLDKPIKVKESPSYRHRGICIEGAVSYEHVRDIIDWAPKVGYNSYFIQFREGYTFFERWYQHENNPFLEAEECSRSQVREYVNDLKEEIKKRDLLYHAVGHGWTCEPFGIPGLGWDQKQVDLPEGVEQYLAEVDGKRQLWQGIPLNTNLCYSQPEVRQIIIDDIVNYIEENPEVDLLHFWLADGSNNQCECEACRQKRPADFYVMMLNELDQILKDRKLDTKIVFLIYVDLLWPPETETINNQERFVLMFAPITRTYSHEFSLPEQLPQLPDYRRNELEFPKNVAENLAFLKEWQQLFPGDSFDFDYHFMWDHIKDPGYMQIAAVLARDIKNLADIGLNGIISCQVQRAFFPTGLGMEAMGRLLWDKSIDYSEIVDDYFKAAFGKDYQKCINYLEELSYLFDPPYLRGEKEKVNEESAARFAEIPDKINQFQSVIKENINNEEKQLQLSQQKSWLYLKHHAEICTVLARALLNRAKGNDEQASNYWQQLKTMVQKKEKELHQVLDVYLFIKVMEQIFD